MKAIKSIAEGTIETPHSDGGKKMKYYMTVERTARIDIEFEAVSEEAAIKIANSRCSGEELDDSLEFDSGNISYDYALCDQTGRTIIDWS